MKIVIFGCIASGKSTLAQSLATKLSLPVYFLDQWYWVQEGQRDEKDIFIQKVEKMMYQESSWVIDCAMRCVAKQIAQQADIIIFLDIPWYICLWRMLVRWLKGALHGDLPVGRRQGHYDTLAYKYGAFIWRFAKRRRPWYVHILHEQKKKKKVFVCRNQREVDTCVQKLQKM